MAIIISGSCIDQISIMKILVLALCVCAASAATVFPTDTGAYKPWQKPVQAVEPVEKTVVKAVVQPIIEPVQTVAKAVFYTDNEAESPVLRSESDVKPDGFNYAYETGNGINAEATGVLKRVDDADVLAIQGAFQFKTAEGIPVDFTYTADENGYQPKSAVIPVAPPVPEYIIRALEYIRTHPSKEQVKPL